MTNVQNYKRMKIKKKTFGRRMAFNIESRHVEHLKIFLFIIVSRASPQERKTETALKSSEDELAHTESKEDALYPRLPN